MKTLYICLIAAFSCGIAHAVFTSTPRTTKTPEATAQQNTTQGSVEAIKYGDFEHWLVRNIKESGIIGGKTKTLYHPAPSATWNNNNPYLGTGGTPWACSNVMAKVAGIYKTNISVYRDTHPGHGYCAKLYTHLEECKAMGLVNIKVLAAGSLFLGQMMEPISSVKNPMSKMNAGIPFTKRPKALMFDYKVALSSASSRIKQTGLGGASTVAGKDYADCILYLQKRWEDEKGNIHALRVGTLVVRFTSSSDWKNNARFNIVYGDASKQSGYTAAMGLTTGKDVKYAKNSKGKLVKIQEEGWAEANETPTHMCLQFDSSHGGAFVGSVGNTLWVDNVRLVY